MTSAEARNARTFGVACSVKCIVFPNDDGTASIWKPKYGKGDTMSLSDRTMLPNVLLEQKKVTDL